MAITRAQLKDSLTRLNKLPLLDDDNLKRAFENIAERMQANEDIEYVFSSDNIPSTYLLVATNRRVLIISRPLHGKEHEFELSYKNTRNVTLKKGIFSPKIIIQTRDGRIYRFRTRSYEECIMFAEFINKKIKYIL
ncbi:MAG: PH domain-containing protein [Candidatus Cloacimonetes bacterium]|nr:PH domain-containing protein [Candidatus Cloacimonadota bacterium]